MEKKKRSFGSLFLGFIRGLLTLILILVLVVSVGINILFYSSESAPKINIADYHYTFFVNNSDELANIDNGSFVAIDHNSVFAENTYVLCSVGSGYKTIMCLSSITENENGTLSYNLRGDKQGSVSEYSVPESKLLGTVMNKFDIIGDVIKFAKEIPGLATLMAIPAFLLIILSVTSIRRKKARYDDELLEAEIYIEELRKAKRSEEKRNLEIQKKNIQAEQGITPAAAVSTGDDVSYEEYTRQPVVEAPEESSVTVPVHQENAPAVNKYEYVNFEDEAARKAIEIKKALLKETYEKTEEPAPAIQASPDPAVNSVLNRVQNQIAAEQNSSDFTAASVYSEQLNPAAPVFQKEPEPVVQNEPAAEPMRFVDYTEIKRAEAQKAAEPAAPAPVPAAEAPKAPAAPAESKPKRPVKKMDAESIDDLIRIIEAEKKKLDQ